MGWPGWLTGCFSTLLLIYSIGLLLRTYVGMLPTYLFYQSDDVLRLRPPKSSVDKWVEGKELNAAKGGGWGPAFGPVRPFYVMYICTPTYVGKSMDHAC